MVPSLAVLLALAVLSFSTGATTLTFDDLDVGSVPGFMPIQNGYGGLDWTNMDVLNAETCSPCGYANGVVSESNVAFNAFGDPASVSRQQGLTLNSFYITAAWNDGLNISVTGKLAGVTVHSTTFTIDTSGPVLKTFNWAGIDEVDLVSSGGVPHGFSREGEQFALDDLAITIAEPETSELILGGLAVVVIRQQRRLYLRGRQVRSLFTRALRFLLGSGRNHQGPLRA